MSTTDTPTPAEVFPVGDFIREEREARGWSMKGLAEALGVPVPEAHAIEQAGSVTASVAERLQRAFGVSAATWLNLGMAYRNATVEHKSRLPGVSRPVS